MIPIILILIVFALSPAFTQKAIWDSLNIQYEIVHMEFHDSENIIKIKLPPYLSTSEVMEQVRLAAYWPGTPPPKKKIRIYVFRDYDSYGAGSNTGALYIPDKGFLWDLRDWKPETTALEKPSLQSIEIYNAVLDSVFKKGASLSNIEARTAVAGQFNLSVEKVDSIFYQIKRWLEIHKKGDEELIKYSDDLYIKVR